MSAVDVIGATFWTPANITRVTGGRWLSAEPRSDLPLRGVNTDTRTIGEGQVFVALRGERFDAHDYIDAAIERGAGLVVVEREVAVNSARAAVLVVEDTVAALQAMAKAWRVVLGEAGCRVIAITGSNGKTTTRHLIHAALSTGLNGSQSPKSFNNHIGVPLTLLAAKAEQDFVAVEIGSNHPGEVAALANIVQPDAAVVVSVGREHMEFFGTLEGVAKEEGAVLSFVRGGGVAVVNDEAWRLIEPTVTLSAGVRVVRYGEGDDADVRLSDEQPLALPLLGRHNQINALAALAVARWAGVDEAAARAGLAKVQPVEGRLQVLRYGDDDAPITVLHDAYNANPDSMLMALQTLAEQPVGDGGRRIAVLGDMFELGDAGPEEHRAIGRRLVELRDVIEQVMLIGQFSLFAAEAMRGDFPEERMRVYAAWEDGLPTTFAAMLQPGDVVLLKASRGMRLERLLMGLEGR